MNVNANLKPAAQSAAPVRGASQYATVEQIETVMGLPTGSISPIAWLVLQEEALGVKVEQIAANLRVEIDDIASLRDSTTGCADDESKEIWLKGIIGLRTVAIVNQQNIGSGWDAIEAMAVDKVARTLGAMRGPGDIDRMMQLATMANKAIRRTAGEGARGPSGNHGAMPPGGVSLELSSGHLGTLRLNLSPAIQQQLSNPTRVIDAVRNKDQVTAGKSVKLEMLNLKDTRALADTIESGQPILDQEPNQLDQPERINGMVFEFPEDQ